MKQTDWSKLPHMKIGQHIALTPGIFSVDGSSEASSFAMAKRMVVEFAKATDQALLQAIIARAREEGISDLYVLDDEFIIGAIREKIEREEQEHAESNCTGL